MGKSGALTETIPGSLSPELTGLTMVEQQMIARAHAVCKVYLKPGVQYTYKGRVVSISQDITPLATDHPLLPNSEELSITIQRPNGVN